MEATNIGCLIMPTHFPLSQCFPSSVSPAQMFQGKGLLIYRQDLPIEPKLASGLVFIYPSLINVEITVYTTTHGFWLPPKMVASNFSKDKHHSCGYFKGLFYFLYTVYLCEGVHT